MTFYLIGARGRLGQSIADEYANSEIISLERYVYEDWSQAGAADLVSRYFEKSSHAEATVFVASGLLDPKLSYEELLSVNYHLPKNVIDGATKLGMKVVTFGTVMEGVLQLKNHYIQSKTALGEYVSVMAGDAKPVLHLQIHTLFGRGQPSPFMFLGQMLAAIRANQTFKMTSGRQLREYHHLADEAKAIRQIATSEQYGVMNLSHGKPLSLRTIAESVFEVLGKSDLLGVGALPDPPDENYEKILEPSGLVQQIAFRDSLPAIVQYMQACCSCDEAEA